MRDTTLPLVLGDPDSSPVWTEIAKQLDLNEMADFEIKAESSERLKTLLSFDAEGLVPADFLACSTWRCELVFVGEADDLSEEPFQMLLYNPSVQGRENAAERGGNGSGSSSVAEELDTAFVHYRFRRWAAEDCVSCMSSSRERIAIIPGYGLVPIEAADAPPVKVELGEGNNHIVDLALLGRGAGITSVEGVLV